MAVLWVWLSKLPQAGAGPGGWDLLKEAWWGCLAQRIVLRQEKQHVVALWVLLWATRQNSHWPR